QFTRREIKERLVYSPITQRQSSRLLIERFLVRIQVGEREIWVEAHRLSWMNMPDMHKHTHSHRPNNRETPLATNSWLAIAGTQGSVAPETRFLPNLVRVTANTDQSRVRGTIHPRECMQVWLKHGDCKSSLSSSWVQIPPLPLVGRRLSVIT